MSIGGLHSAADWHKTSFDERIQVYFKESPILFQEESKLENLLLQNHFVHQKITSRNYVGIMPNFIYLNLFIRRNNARVLNRILQIDLFSARIRKS